MTRRAFTTVELVIVLVVVSAAAALGLSAASEVITKVRRDDQAQAALAQIRRLRADALTRNESAAVETAPLPSGGTRVTTALVRPLAGTGQCTSYRDRVSRIEEHDYDLLQIDNSGSTSSTLCFDSFAFRLLNADGLTLAPAATQLDLIAEGSGTTLGSLVVSPTGTLDTSYVPGVDEGQAAVVNVPPVPAPEDPARYLVEPGQLKAELPVTQPPPPDPTTPVGQVAIEALPPPTDPPPPNNPPACVTDPDCSALGAGFVCRSGECVDGSLNCSQDSDCPTVEFGCEIATGTCTQPCNRALCPATPHTCGGCQMLDCCIVYGCPCA
jgi:type II secretory pathway pseudopilin PulG